MIEERRPYVLRIRNDFYLNNIEDVNCSIGKIEYKYKDFEVKSAYIKKENTYHGYVKRFQPKYSHTEGGKGLAFYTRPVCYHTVGISIINNLNISHGCPANCGYCRESSNSRSFTEVDVKEKSGKIKFKYKNENMEVLSKAKVKFYDTHRKIIVYGSIQIPIYYGFPISKDSLLKLKSGKLFRVLQD
jgi:hypothetical protein